MGECCNNKEDISLSCHCGANDSFKSNSSQPKCQNCSVKKKVRSEKEFKALLNRLSRIEGQVRGVRSMLENDAYCISIHIAEAYEVTIFSNLIIQKKVSFLGISDVR